jgi:hypothetical protein
MSSNDVPAKTAPADSERENRFRQSGAIRGPAVLDEVDARQAVTGLSVRYVLAFGLAGVVIALAVILVFDLFYLH